MSKPVIRIHNMETDEIIDREMTDDEYAQFQAKQAKVQAEAEAQALAETKRLAALAKLTALGFDEDDLKALGLNPELKQDDEDIETIG